MDLGLYFIIAIIMAFVTWLVGKIWGYRAKETIRTIVVLAVVLPIFIIAIVGMLGMLQEPEAAEEIAASTIDTIINYVVEKLPYILISDIAGIIVGRVVGFFTGRED